MPPSWSNRLDLRDLAPPEDVVRAVEPVRVTEAAGPAGRAGRERRGGE